MNENNLDNISGTCTQTKPIGRILRFLLGVLFISISVPYYLGSKWESILTILGIAIALLLFYALIHFFISNYFSRVNTWVGIFLTLAPVSFAFLLPGTQGDVAALTFVGVSLLIQGLRGDPGCEVMTIPSIIFGKRTYLCCLLFSPIDRLEQKIFKRD